MANPDSFLADNDALIAYNKDSRDKGKETNAPTEQTVQGVQEAQQVDASTLDSSRMFGNVNNTYRDLPDNTTE